MSARNKYIQWNQLHLIKSAKKNTVSNCSEHKRKNCDVCKYMSPYDKEGFGINVYELWCQCWGARE